MSFKCGIVGLPNVGKSTLFNALTSSASADAANYPFCTIEPNVGSIAVPDNRLKIIAKIGNSQKIIPAHIDFVDIAGLVKGASQGEGLGNKFLSHIREVDAIGCVLRCFDDENITHVSGKIDPIADAEIIEMELMLADIESVERQLLNLEKKARNDKSVALRVSIANKVAEALRNEKPALSIINADNEQEIRSMNLLSTKPVFYICNVLESDVVCGNSYTNAVKLLSVNRNRRMVIVSAKIESEMMDIVDAEEKAALYAELGLCKGALDEVARCGYEILNMITFFTVGPKETHAWDIKRHTKAPEAAGCIHSDFERGFICAEIIGYNDYVALGDGARTAGKMRTEGKNYIIEDGDVVHFRFNV